MNELDRIRKLAGILTESVMAVPGLGVKENESDMQTMATAVDNNADAAANAASPQLTEGVSKFETTILNPQFDHSDENSQEEIDVTVFYSVSGEYVPARIKYDDYDHPEEYPELYIEQVVDENGNDISQLISPREFKNLEEQVWDHINSQESDFDEPDYDYKDDFYESPDIMSGKPAVHTFENSTDAYDATQMGEWMGAKVKNGDILVIPDEGVVGICSTWPVAVTVNSGELHSVKPEYATPENVAEIAKLSIDVVQAAFAKAQELGFETIGSLAEDLNNGYNDVNYADGNDYFPDGADSPVTTKVGPSGASQGDNPEQKRMEVAETHKELVYSYRKFLKESAIK